MQAPDFLELFLAAILEEPLLDNHTRKGKNVVCYTCCRKWGLSESKTSAVSQPKLNKIRESLLLVSAALGRYKELTLLSINANKLVLLGSKYKPVPVNLSEKELVWLISKNPLRGDTQRLTCFKTALAKHFKLI